MANITTGKRSASIFAAIVIAGSGGAMGYHTGVHDSPSIPRCIHDDYNDGTQKVCYTVNYSTGTVTVIDKNDEVVS